MPYCETGTSDPRHTDVVTEGSAALAMRSRTSHATGCSPGCSTLWSSLDGCAMFLKAFWRRLHTMPVLSGTVTKYMSSSPCSPPSPCTIVCVVHHPPTSTLTAFHKTWTRMALRCMKTLMARREIRSNALARGLSSVIPCSACATPRSGGKSTEKERWHPVPLPSSVETLSLPPTFSRLCRATWRDLCSGQPLSHLEKHSCILRVVEQWLKVLDGHP